MSVLRSVKRFIGQKGTRFLENSRWLSYFLKKFSCYIVRNDPEMSNYRYTFGVIKLLQDRHITAILDVGACNGNYAFQLRKLGYQHKLISFEPVTQAFQELSRRAAEDPLWSFHQIALGDQEENKKIHVLKELAASSFLDTSVRHREVNPLAFVIHEEEVQVQKLDALYSQFCSPSDRVFLKIDTQGYEKRVLEGARDCLEKIDLVQLEVSLEPLYEEELLLPELFSYMKTHSFIPIALDPLSVDPKTGEFLQMDILFSNKRRACKT